MIMKKNTLPLLLFILLLGCSGQKKTVTVPVPSIFDFTSTINLEGLKADLSVLSHDSLEGRNTGSEGEAKAAKFLAQRYATLGLEPVGDNDTYFQGFKLARASEVKTNNVVAFLEGSDPVKKEEVIVLSAHYDHLGISQPDSTGDAIYNGADDNGSGTIALLHIAQAMVAAQKAGAGPKRSVLFLHVSAEELGLLGSRYYSENPIFPIENTVANLNADMIGGRDQQNTESGDYIYIIGGSIISSDVDSLVNLANQESVNINLSDRYNDLSDPLQLYRRSDHWNFGRLGIPFIFFFSGLHDNYHQPSDEIDKIDFDALTKRSQLIFTTAAKIANADERPEVDNQAFIEITQLEPR
ncbi:MAG: M28 family metallopeptidase [Balneolaceae bacterium]